MKIYLIISLLAMLGSNGVHANNEDKLIFLECKTRVGNSSLETQLPLAINLSKKIMIEGLFGTIYEIEYDDMFIRHKSWCEICEEKKLSSETRVNRLTLDYISINYALNFVVNGKCEAVKQKI